MKVLDKNSSIVSIIMNCHNGERYLKESLKSVLNQSYRNWELIFFDNASTDKSKYIFNTFADSRFKYFFSKKKINLYKARNLAIKETKGNFIAFIDVDDWWEKKNLSSRKDFFLKEEYAFSYSNCFNFFLKKKIKRFIQVGSSMEYGHAKSPQKENIKCVPKSLYGKAKFLSTQYLLKLHKKKKFPVTIVRLYQVYGSHQDFNRFIPIVINSCKYNKDFPCSHGRQFRDFLHIDDLINVFFLILKNPKVEGEIFNIGFGRPLKIKNIIKKIIKYYKAGRPQFSKIKLRKEEQIKIYPNLSKAMNILKWKAKINLSQGLKKTIKYYNAN